MLSSAHILAMDTKNLLDVVDSIRIRFPNVVLSPIVTVIPIETASQLPQDENVNSNQVHQQFQQPFECYENVAHMSENVEQLYSNQHQQQQEAGSGIYDNECVIKNNQHSFNDQQLKIVEETTDLYCNTSAKVEQENDSEGQIPASCTKIVQIVTTSQKVISN